MTTLPQTTSGLHLPRPMGPGAPGAPMAPIGAYPGASTSLSQGHMSSGDVWRVLRSNALFLIVALVVSGALGVVLNMYLKTYYARYTATGYVQVQPSKSKSATLLGERGDEATLSDDPATLAVEQRTQAALMLSEALITRALQDPNSQIRKTEWFSGFTNPDGSIDIAGAKEDLAKKFDALPIADTKLIKATFTYRNPKDCKTVVDELVTLHIEDQKKISSDSLLNRKNALEQLKAKHETTMRQLRQENSRAQGELQMDNTGKPGAIAQKEQELFQLITARIKAEGDAAEAKASYDSANNDVQSGNTPGAVEQMVSQQGTVSYWSQFVDQLDVEIQSMAQGNGTPQATQLIARRAAGQQKLDATRAEQRANLTVAYLGQLNSRVAGTQHEMEALSKSMEKLHLDISDLSFQLASYVQRKDEETALEEMTRRERDQLDRLGTAISALDMNTVLWNTRPVTPDTPSFPQMKYILPLTMIAGLALCLGIAFLREVMDQSVRSPRDIARVGQLTLLGMIPHEDDDPQAAGVPLASVIYAAPSSMLAEQFRQVRTRLQHAASLDTTRSILITSPGPGDGKSVVACNLAAGLALNGRRILLVDANFRRPELHKIFGVGNDSGFSNVLNSVENFESGVRQTKVPNLDLMTTGPRPANATELLESQLLIDFIERALEEYDHVIFDSGPMMVVSETPALAPRVDGVVTVVRARSNSRGLLSRMKDNLRQLKAENLGVVLNGVRSLGGGYYGQNIKTYYDYQSGEAA